MSFRKVELRDFNSFELLTSPTSQFIIIKLNNINGKIEKHKEILSSELKTDYLSQPGVYFLRLNNGYYIGETTDLFKRMNQHIKDKEINTITFATHKSEIDRLDKEQIRDIESLLIEYAMEANLTLGEGILNKRNENRKVTNVFKEKEHRMQANEIWKRMAMLNVNDFFDKEVNAIEESIAAREFEKSSQSYSAPRNKIEPFDSETFDPDEIAKQNLKSITTKNDVKLNISKVDYGHDIFKDVPLRRLPTNAYNKDRIEIFNKENTKRCLLKYLWEGKSNGLVDIELTRYRKRTRGWITAATLAYMGMETNGSARNSLSSWNKIEVEDLIDEFVEYNYN